MKNINKIRSIFSCFLLLLILFSCDNKNNQLDNIKPEDQISDFYLGVDLSYVNEIENCSNGFFSQDEKVDPFQLFSNEGTNIIRVRLWHNPALIAPTFSAFSGISDVEKTIRRAKNKDMKVLLDIHYSDTWADPAKQWIPNAWKDIVDIEILKDSVYNYTFKTLIRLNNKNLAPEIVQVGNEINSQMLMPFGTSGEEIEWNRNKKILLSGIQAVRDAANQMNKKIEVMLHIAQPENAFWFFDQAIENSVTDFDWIGVSYYPKWSDVEFKDIAYNISQLKTRFQKKIMIVETAYPFTLKNFDNQGNILNEDALIEGFPATPQGQKEFMIALTQAVMDGGGKGVVYWEPAWIANSCQTLFGTGSSWENASFFNAETQNEALPVFEFLDKKNYILKN